MALLAVQKRGARVSLEGESVVVSVFDRVVARKPLFEIDEVHLYGDIEVAPVLRTELLRRGVDTVLLTPAGSFLGRLFGAEPRWVRRRMAQYALLAIDEHRSALAQFCVVEKLRGQRALLQRAAREAPEGGDGSAIASLRQLIARAEDEANVEVLRGIEGLGASMYFRGLGAAVRNPAFVFERRTRRPPEDPFNACLSFGYTLLLRKVEAALMRAGLDVGLGALHEPLRGRPSLALDLMEPYRVLVDRMVSRLVNTRQLDAKTFVRPPSEASSGASESVAVHLGPEGREVFIRAWGKLLRARFELGSTGERHELAMIFERQARHFGRGIEDGEIALLPFRIR